MKLPSTYCELRFPRTVMNYKWIMLTEILLTVVDCAYWGYVIFPQLLIFSLFLSMPLLCPEHLSEIYVAPFPSIRGIGKIFVQHKWLVNQFLRRSCLPSFCSWLFIFVGASVENYFIYTIFLQRCCSLSK